MDIYILLVVLIAALLITAGSLALRRRALDRDLRRAEGKTLAILEATVDAIITTDSKGIIDVFNPAAERMFGYGRDEVIGRNVSMLMAEKRGGRLIDYRVSGIQGRRRDGSVFPMEMSVGGYTDAAGQRLFAGVVRDVTNRQRAEQDLRDSETRTRAILETAVDGIVTIDERGIIRSANRATERLFGYAADEMIGNNVSMLMPEPYRSEHDGYLNRYRTTGERRIIGIGREVEGRRKDGSIFPMDLAVGEAFIGGNRIFTGIVRDITDRKLAEEALRAAKEEAERANVAKSKFLAAASHDLRQPVQALVFFATALEAKMDQTSEAGVLGNIMGSLNSLNTLLDALLDVSRLDAGIVVPRPSDFSLSVLLDQMATDAKPSAIDKRLIFKVVNTSAIIRTDPVLLGRIIQNLLTNAIRYTDRGGRILLGCRRSSNTVRIEVWDSGIGIPPARLGEIFQEFYQVGNSERDRNLGLGLGLAIVKRLSTLLGCRVNVRSCEGRGSVFSIEVPLVGYSKARNVAFLETPLRGPEARKGVVLIIDDETAILTGLRLVLESWGYQVIAATSEADALFQLEQGAPPPDVILADYRLREGHTGAEAVAHIREQFGFSVPAVIITGDTAPERLREAEAHGLKLLHKPVPPALLQTVIAEHLKG